METVSDQSDFIFTKPQWLMYLAQNIDKTDCARVPCALCRPTVSTCLGNLILSLPIVSHWFASLSRTKPEADDTHLLPQSF